jgi:hypothetical protein
MQTFQLILTDFEIMAAAEIISFGNGLINNTWKVIDGANTYILQRVNTSVFKNPYAIAYNIEAIGIYLKKTHPA